MPFSIGEQVRVIEAITIQGEVQGATVNDDLQVLYLVAFDDCDGEPQTRYFKMEELEAVV